MEMVYKENIQKITNDLLDSLKNIKNINLKESSDEHLKQSFENIKNTIIEGIDRIKSNTEKILKFIEWETFNVSFFGETNAGKSTIIEALTQGSGETIGDGRKDFTREIAERIYKDIKLIDMPGIEGKEQVVRERIFEAVAKSHIVFCVVPDNKAGYEQRTLNKIKQYLEKNESVKVYSIINIRAKPSSYRNGRKLLNPSHPEIFTAIETQFREIFGKNYGKNIYLNAYLAFLSNKNIQEKFLKDRQKAEEIFGSIDKVRTFSNIEELYKILHSFQNSMKRDILITNTYKLLKNIENIASNLLREKKNFDKIRKESFGLIDEKKEKINKLIHEYQNRAINMIDVKLSEMKSEFKREISDAIEKGLDQQQMEKKSKEVSYKYVEEINNKLKDIINELNKEIENEMKELKDRITLYANLLKFDTTIDFKNILESLKISLSYIFKQLVDVLLRVLSVVVAFLVNPIVGIVTLVDNIIVKIWEWFYANPEKKRKEATQKAFQEIESEVNNKKNELKQKAHKQFEDLNSEINRKIKEFEKKLKGINYISSELDKFIEDIKRARLSISKQLIQNVISDAVDFAYIDLHLNEAVIVGDFKKDSLDVSLEEIFRVKKFHIFSSFNELIKMAGEVKHDFFEATSEFFKRVMQVLQLKNERLDAHISGNFGKILNKNRKYTEVANEN